MSEEKRFVVYFFLNTNPRECSKGVVALTKDFATEDVRQQLTELYSKHGFRITRVERDASFPKSEKQK